MNTNQVFSDEDVEKWAEEEEADSLIEGYTQTEDAAEKYARSQLRMVRETKDFQLDYLQYALVPGKDLIDTSPSYQRRLRWPRKKRARLIESFLLNIPVPPVYLFERDYNEYEVIDGRQRLETIREFLTNNFALTGLEYWSELNGKRINDLPTVLQKGLLRRSLPAVVLLAETKDSEKDEIDIRRVLFDRLNTGGISLNAQELRNALYPGPLNALLIKLARTEPFTTAWMIPPYRPGEDDEPYEALAKNTLFKSLADAELVLRFFALRDAIQNDRRGSLLRILDRFMKANALITVEVQEEFREEFINLLSRLVSVFDQKPFRIPKTNRPSRPLYDALMVALSQNPKLDIESDADGIRQRLNSALIDPVNYDILVGRGNTVEAVHKRVKLAAMILSS